MPDILMAQGWRFSFYEECEYNCSPRLRREVCQAGGAVAQNQRARAGFESHEFL
jgi:hypothetical protein